jgi:hypothetical protein
MASVTPAMTTSWAVSAGVTARMLPMTMVWTFTLVGDSETMKRPRPKKVVKISPMTASCLSRVIAWSERIAAAARRPARKAPAAKGRPSM